MERKAVVALLTWDRVVPWKILCLPRDVRAELVPLGFGSNVRVLHPGTTIWAVAAPKIEGVPPTLVARVRIDRSYRQDDPPDDRSKFLSDMLKQWKFVGTSHRGSRFFELNDATDALDDLGLSMSQLGFRKSVVVDPNDAARAFRTCTSSKKPVVFVSYTHARGAEIALPLVGSLLNDGLRPWLDHLALPGFELHQGRRIDNRRLDQLIRLGIQHSRFAVALKTKDWGYTAWTRKERRWIMRRREERNGFRCVQVAWTRQGFSGFDACLAPAPVSDLTRAVVSALRG